MDETPPNAATAWNEGDTRTAYDEVADTYADHFAQVAPEAPIDVAMIDHFASLVTGERRVLDAGCGAGRMLPVLARAGCCAEGVDLSPRMVERARRDHPNFPVSVASLTDLPHADATFDGVFSWYSTIHTDDAGVAAMIRECGRVLRPGGVLLLGFQTGDGVRDVADVYRRRGHDIVLMRYGRQPSLMLHLARDAGFEEVALMQREPAAGERDGQAVVIVRKPPIPRNSGVVGAA